MCAPEPLGSLDKQAISRKLVETGCGQSMQAVSPR